MNAVKGRCPRCGGLVATLEAGGAELTWGRFTADITTEDFAVYARTSVTSCRQGHRYPLIDVVSVLRRAQHLGKASVKLPVSTMLPTTV